MENEIKVGDWIRTEFGEIGKVFAIEENPKRYFYDEYGNNVIENSIVKHSPNLIDLIQCRDYVNGKEVIMDLQKSKEWYKSKDDFITCKDYTFEENEIETIVTKETMESISYKVKE